MNNIDAIIGELRIPGLPYPMGPVQGTANWGQVLRHGWVGQADCTVVDILKETDATWTIKQVNAAYLADRIMDVFLRKSGLHATLVGRAARLRFYLACRLEREGATVMDKGAPLRQWLDHLAVFRGWTDRGRSSRRLLARLDALVPVIEQAFEDEGHDAEAHFLDWLAADHKLEHTAARLRSRLLETESGAARQRAAESCSTHRVAKALAGRMLPPDAIAVIDGPWLALLRQTVLCHGIDSDLWRQACRCLDWAVWALDPALSAGDRARLYQVAEELPVRLAALWQEMFSETFPLATADELQRHLVARVRGDEVERVPAERQPPDPFWSERPRLPDEVKRYLGHWMVTGDGGQEQRRLMFAYLDTTGEVLWLNSEGVKQGLEPADLVARNISAGEYQVLPDPLPFDTVLDMTISALSRVLGAQREQRHASAERARQQAAVLRRKQQEERAQAEERARMHAQEVERRLCAEQEEARRVQEARDAAAVVERELKHSELVAQIDALHLGAWIEVLSDADEPVRLKLAVKMNATGKLVFVDRLGLNQRVLYRTELADMIVDRGARVLDKGAEFEDTLSRVVGRIRVGR